MHRILLPFFLAASVCAQDLEPIKPIERRIPPQGIEIPHDVRQQLQGRVDALRKALKQLPNREEKPDSGVLLKGVDFALRNGEFYDPKDFKTAERHLDLAEKWIAGKGREARRSGLAVRGYESRIDGSLQPYGLEIPESLDLSKPAPLLVWLHGRGDKITDLHFIDRCLTRSQVFQGKIADQEEWIVLHPFGRQCVGWKHAGEIDVFDAIRSVMREFEIDRDRIVLAGFSMGGAGAWHIGAHHNTDHFAAIHAGAGFAETKLYTKLKPEDYPPSYEQTLWGLYDVPNYARNLLNVPVIAYSGENDKQKQAADVMEAALAEHGLELKHVIGPGMGHKYHDDSVPVILEFLREARFDESRHRRVELQTRTTRYGWQGWIAVTGLEEHWKDARFSAEKTEDRAEITTQNVTHLTVAARLPNGSTLVVDGQTLAWPDGALAPHLRKADEKWEFAESDWRAGDPLRKRTNLQGPIDDAFMEPFLVVKPDRPPRNPLVRRWVEFELTHFEKRWRELMRGELRIKSASEVTDADRENYNLICFGDPVSNPEIARVLPKLPIMWTDRQLLVDGQFYELTNHLPVMIYPNPLNPTNYVVLNSGLTFREGHDRTNSLQNPKLPDWAVLDLRQDPDNLTAGKVVAADFFDEAWQFKP